MGNTRHYAAAMTAEQVLADDVPAPDPASVRAQTQAAAEPAIPVATVARLLRHAVVSPSAMTCT